jgi:predicted DNA binding protein
MGRKLSISGVTYTSAMYHFEALRKITLEELGGLLGITHQAVIARLRNGEKNILETQSSIP